MCFWGNLQASYLEKVPHFVAESLLWLVSNCSCLLLSLLSTIHSRLPSALANISFEFTDVLTVVSETIMSEYTLLKNRQRSSDRDVLVDYLSIKSVIYYLTGNFFSSRLLVNCHKVVISFTSSPLNIRNWKFLNHSQ